MSNNSKLYTHAGWSTLEGERKMRAASSAKRVQVLKYCGHTDIDMHELPVPMNWAEVQEYLINNKLPASVQERAAAQVATPVAEEAVVPEEVVAEAAVAAQLTFEEALAQVPLREKGRFIKREVREEMARKLMAGEAVAA